MVLQAVNDLLKVDPIADLAGRTAGRGCDHWIAVVQQAPESPIDVRTMQSYRVCGQRSPAGAAVSRGAAHPDVVYGSTGRDANQISDRSLLLRSRAAGLEYACRCINHASVY